MPLLVALLALALALPAQRTVLAPTGLSASIIHRHESSAGPRRRQDRRNNRARAGSRRASWRAGLACRLSITPLPDAGAVLSRA